MKYKYGASFNCVVTQEGRRAVVGGGGRASLDYVSNELDKLSEFLEAQKEKYIITSDHSFVDGVCELGEGRIVAILGELDEDGVGFSVVAVVFEDPRVPTW